MYWSNAQICSAMSDAGDWEDLSGDELVLPDLGIRSSSSAAYSTADNAATASDEDWLNATKPPPVSQPEGTPQSATKRSKKSGATSSNDDVSDGEPMILVDFTVLSNGVSGRWTLICI